MSTVSVEGEALLATPFDKTAWLERVCRKRADCAEFICCGHNFSDGSGIDDGKTKSWVVEPNTGIKLIKLRLRYTPPVPSRPSWTRKKVSLLWARKRRRRERHLNHAPTYP